MKSERPTLDSVQRARYVSALVAAGDGFFSEAAFESLEPRQIIILHARMIEGRTLKETGSLLIGPKSGKPTHRERVRQLQNTALAKLRQWVARCHNLTK